MCEFCDVISNTEFKDSTIHWSVRSTMADENLEDILNEKLDYQSFHTTHYGFGMYGYKDDKGNVSVALEYRQELTNYHQEVIISPFSEMVQFNFCPMCGKQISKDIKSFEDNHDFIIRAEKK